MSVVFVSGDLFEFAGLDALAHGCNCAGAMGKGIAVEFKRRYPAMFDAYRQRCLEGAFALGDVFPWRAEGRVILNLGTQRTWRTRARLVDVKRALEEMVRVAEEMEASRIGLPRIGAGLGRLPWPSVKALLIEIARDAEVELVVFEEYVPAERLSAARA